MEMCQIELGHAVVEAKWREGGGGALNERDLAHLRRATAIDAERCVLLHPLPPRPRGPGVAAIGLDAIVARLGEVGIEVFGVDLTRQGIAIPAARIIAPGLQLEPSQLTSLRLEAAIREAGGGLAYTNGEKLL
jgi:ribosomal protein S12 methylthiotransferase accessory factor